MPHAKSQEVPPVLLLTRLIYYRAGSERELKYVRPQLVRFRGLISRDMRKRMAAVAAVKSQVQILTEIIETMAIRSQFFEFI